jgi:translation initiation factor 2B subunit (eIF-2B alpha/beta/delta family)
MSEVVRKVVFQEHLPSGVHQLSITGLSNLIDDSSVELWMQPTVTAINNGNFDVEILDIKLGQTEIDRDQSVEYTKTMKTLKDTLDELNQQLTAVERDHALLEQRATSVVKLVNTATAAFNTVSIPLAVQLLDFQDEQTKTINEKRDVVSRRRKDLKERVKETSEAIQNLQDRGTCV